MRTSEILNLRRAEFKKAAYDFFKKIISFRPDTPILFICEDDMLLKEECISAAKKTGIIQTLVFAPKKEYEGVGANGHYSVYTHARVAAAVVRKLRKML